jgi:hypothetical protein
MNFTKNIDMSGTLDSNSEKNYKSIPETIKHKVIKITFSVLALACLPLLIIITRKLGSKVSLPEINSQISEVMYVIAAGNGNALEGAKSLTFFGLGTLPALIGFGLLARTLSNKMTRNLIHTSGIILILFGSMMLNKGFLRALSVDDSKPVQPACECQKMIDQNSGKEVK